MAIGTRCLPVPEVVPPSSGSGWPCLMKEVTVSSPLLSLSDKVVSHCAQPPGFQPQLVTLKFVSSPSLPPETRPQGRMSSWMARRAHCPCEVTLSAVWQSMRSPQQACPPSSTTVCPRPPPYSELPHTSHQKLCHVHLPSKAGVGPSFAAPAAPCPLAATSSRPAVFCTHQLSGISGKQRLSC